MAKFEDRPEQPEKFVFLTALAESDFQIQLVKVPRLRTDSSAALAAAKRIGLSSKLRHLEVAQVYVQELVHRGFISLRKVAGTKNPANVLTKHVAGPQLKEALPALGIVDCSVGTLHQQFAEAKQLTVGAISLETAQPAKSFPWKPQFAAPPGLAQLAILTQLIGTTTAQDPLDQSTTVRWSFTDLLWLVMCLHICVHIVLDS